MDLTAPPHAVGLCEPETAAPTDPETLGAFALADVLDADGSALMVHADADNVADVTERYAPEGRTRQPATSAAPAAVACGAVTPWRSTRASGPAAPLVGHWGTCPERGWVQLSDDGVLREVFDDLRHEAHRRRVQLLAALAYVVLAGGVIYLFSSIGEDSGSFEDVHERTTLAAVGTALSAVGVVLCIATLVVERRVRTRPSPGREPGTLPSQGRLSAATVVGGVLVAVGLLALGRWS